MVGAGKQDGGGRKMFREKLVFIGTYSVTTALVSAQKSDNKQR